MIVDPMARMDSQEVEEAHQEAVRLAVARVAVMGTVVRDADRHQELTEHP